LQEAAYLRGMPLQFFVYILASRSRVLYTGVTRDLLRRVHQHRLGQVPGFTRRYNVDRLVFFEGTPSAGSAFDREKQIKGWKRDKKVRLIESVNGEWLDLAKNWFHESE
jgi:putative endonuclease